MYAVDSMWVDSDWEKKFGPIHQINIKCKKLSIVTCQYNYLAHDPWYKMLQIAKLCLTL